MSFSFCAKTECINSRNHEISNIWADLSCTICICDLVVVHAANDHSDSELRDAHCPESSDLECGKTEPGVMPLYPL